MPIYNYQCKKCNHRFCIEATIQEKEEGKSEKFKCAKCHSRNLKPKFSMGNALKNLIKGDEEKCCANKSSCCDN